MRNIFRSSDRAARHWPSPAPACLGRASRRRSSRRTPKSPSSAPSACGASPTAAAPITIVPVAAALLRIHDAAYYRRLALDLRVGEEFPLDAIATHLESIGYSRRDPVEMVGEYSIRGGILDVFGAETARPLRVEFFGDEIESIRRFDVETQRSVMKISEAQILPLVEQPRSRQLLHAIAEKLDYEGVASPGDIFPGWEFAAALAEPRQHSLLDLAPGSLVVLDEPEQLRAASERLWKRLDQQPSPLAAANFLAWEAFETALASPTRTPRARSRSRPSPPRHSPLARLPRKYAGCRGRSPHHGRARLSRGFLRAHPRRP